MQGFDSIQDSADVELRESFIMACDAAKKVAVGAGTSGKGVAPVQVGIEKMRIRATAPPGHNWVLENDDFMFLIRRPGLPSPVSTRYRAAGLWEHGYVALFNRAQEALRAVGMFRTADYHRVTRVDYAFDFHSPAMTRGMRPEIAGAVVAPSGVKTQTWGMERRLETLTIGSKGGVQVQLYDKSAEINAHPEKVWMHDLWRDRGADPNGGDLWRLECRFGAEYLRNRNLRQMGALFFDLPNMVGEALAMRRLTVPNATDTNRRRWPLHPLWALALASVDPKAMPIIGRKVTGKRSVLLEMLTKQLMGVSRAVSVLEVDGWDAESVRRYLIATGLLIEKQPGHRRKVERLQDRYELVDEAG